MKNRFYFLMVILSSLVYVNTLGFPFVFDDHIYITQNIKFQQIQFLPQYFSENFCEGVSDNCVFYRPIVAITHLFDHLIWGMNPFGHHLTNVAIHVLVVFLFYWFCQQLFQNHRIAFIATLIFSIHPLHAESVAVVANRTDPTAALFFLLSFYFFHRYLLVMDKFRPDDIRAGREKSLSGSGFYFLSLILYGLALLTKEIAITLPVLLLLYEVTFFRPWHGWGGLLSRWRTYLPFGGIVFLYFVLRRRALGYSLTEDLDIGSLGFRFLEAPVIIWDYFRLHVVPYPQTIFHQEPTLFGSHRLAMVWGIIFLGFYLYIFIRTGRMNKGMYFGGLWFVVTLLPVLNLIPLPWPAVVERFSYIPSMGLALALGFLGAYLTAKSWSSMFRWVPRGVMPFFYLVVIIFSAMTIHRNQVWSDEISLWKDTVQKNPNFALGYMNLGLAYHETANIEKAIEAFSKSLELNPAAPKLRHNLALLYQDAGKFNEALEEYEKLIKANQGLPATYYNLGLIYEGKRDHDRAIFYYREAVNRNRHYYKAYIRLGRLLEERKNLEAALEAYQEASRIYPKKLEPFLDIGEVNRMMGRFEEAEQAYLRYLKNAPADLRQTQEYRYVQNRLQQIREMKKGPLG